MDKEFIMEKTSDAEKFAKSTENNLKEVKLNLWDNMSRYRIEEWRKEIDELVDKTGVSLEDAAIYAGLNSTGFYKRLPKSRESYIGIGMAFGAGLDTINEWIVRYGGKRKLYIKNVLSDIVWIYLIEMNYNQFKERPKTRDDFFRKYDEISEAIERVYSENWEVESDYGNTDVIQFDFLESLKYGDEKSLISFVKFYMPQLRSAYLRPRKIIADYVSLIVDTVNKYGVLRRKWTVESLRGYLTDAQMNYISGSYNTSSALDKKGNATKNLKSIPQGKKSHISLGLSLGMTLNDLNDYLELMGYKELDPVNFEEAQLINLLTKWENSHYLQRALKDRKEMKPKEAIKAVYEMLGLINDIKEEYESQEIRNGRGTYLKFPYYKE